jgi:hypothetical protein
MLLHVGYYAVFEHYLHAAVVKDDLVSQISHPGRRAESRLDLIGRLAQANARGRGRDCRNRYTTLLRGRC